MIDRFVEATKSSTIGPQLVDEQRFGVVSEWGRLGVIGNFAVVQYTDKGSVLLCQDDQDKVIGYLAVGVLESIRTFLESFSAPLPVYVRACLVPFKGKIVFQGIGFGSVSRQLEQASIAYLNGDKTGIEILTSLE